MLTLQSTAEEATAFIREHDQDVRNLNRMPKSLLAIVYAERSGGLMDTRELSRWSKDQLINSATAIRYPAEQMGLAIHLRAHSEIWPDCEYCQDQDRHGYTAHVLDCCGGDLATGHRGTCTPEDRTFAEVRRGRAVRMNLDDVTDRSVAAIQEAGRRVSAEYNRNMSDVWPAIEDLRAQVDILREQVAELIKTEGS